MSVNNPVFRKLVEAISPVVSIGVGSAVFTVCSQMGLKPMYLEDKDLMVLKPALVDHYQKYWSNKLDRIQQQLARV